jgi:hypothetical protein
MTGMTGMTGIVGRLSFPDLAFLWANGMRKVFVGREYALSSLFDIANPSKRTTHVQILTILHLQGLHMAKIRVTDLTRTYRDEDVGDNL